MEMNRNDFDYDKTDTDISFSESAIYGMDIIIYYKNMIYSDRVTN